MPELTRFELALLHRLAENTKAELPTPQADADPDPARMAHDGLTLEVPVSCLALAALERLVATTGRTVDEFTSDALLAAVERMPVERQGAAA